VPVAMLRAQCVKKKGHITDMHVSHSACRYDERPVRKEEGSHNLTCTDPIVPAVMMSAQCVKKNAHYARKSGIIYCLVLSDDGTLDLVVTRLIQ
jgi:hypothetical protein